MATVAKLLRRVRPWAGVVEDWGRQPPEGRLQGCVLEMLIAVTLDCDSLVGVLGGRSAPSAGC